MELVHRLFLIVIVSLYFLLQINGADIYTDQNRPYEFGFRIDGEQHRHEKKDKNGIIMGEFGFITADDVYHVTVYATDEQGRFKILSMKNIHLKESKSVTSARQGHSLQIPSTHQVSTVQVTTTTTQPTKKFVQEIKPISLEPPVNSCSHCSLPTTSTAAPKPSLSSISNTNTNSGSNISSKIATPFGSPQYNSFDPKSFKKTESQASSGQFNGPSSNEPTQQTPISSPQNTNLHSQLNYAAEIGLQQNNSPAIPNEGQSYPQNLEPSQNYPKQGINVQGQNYSPNFETQPKYTPQETNRRQNYPQIPATEQNVATLGTAGEQNYSQEKQKNYLSQTNNSGKNYPPLSRPQDFSTLGQNYAPITGTQQIYTPKEINEGESYPQTPVIAQSFTTLGTSREQNYPQQKQNNYLTETNNAGQNYRQAVDTQQNYQPNRVSDESNQTPEAPGVFRPNINQKNSFNIPQSTTQETGISNVGSAGINNARQKPGETLQLDNSLGIRTPKQLNGESQPVPVVPGQKPKLAYAQMQIVDKNTDIHAKALGEKEGLPQGLTENDMVRLLYTFNYTLGFQGHFEEGYSNGVKQGYYFVTGRNGIKTRVDYIADDKGFHPKISQDVLDLLSDDVPKPETEKQAKYGLKGYEFKWLYYPVDTKSR